MARVRPQEVVIDGEDVAIDAADLVEFLNQGGSIAVVNGSRLLIFGQDDAQQPELDATEESPWQRIRQSCGVRYRTVSAIAVRSGSTLGLRQVAIKNEAGRA